MKYKSMRQTFPGTIEELSCHQCGERENLNLLFRKDGADDFETRCYCDNCLDYEPEPDCDEE